MTTPTNLTRSLDRLRLKWASTLPEPAPKPAPPPLEDPWEFPCVERFAGSHLHGRTMVSSIAGCDASSLGIAAPPQRWAFLDTETTGLAGGTGTYAFLIGVGMLDADGSFRIHQFFMRDFCDEPQVLDDLAALLRPYDVLVTYNGKSYDAPLLETRYRMSRKAVPHESMEHLDLVHAARRLWKLRLPSCRLLELESSVVGYKREGDIPGELIPYRYFEYLRTGRMSGLTPVFHHNRMDILTLACVTSLVLGALGDPTHAPLHGPDLYGLAGWLARLGRSDSALEVYARALPSLPADLAAQARWEMAAIYKRAGDYPAAIPLWRQIDTPEACIELAKYHEHRARDYPAALYFARQAGDAHRLARLERKATAMGN